MLHSKLKFLPILLLGIIPVKQAQSMEPQTNSNTTLHHIASNMTKALQKSDKKTNSVSCPLGVAQTLASLSLIIKDDAPKDEIKNFTGDPQLAENMGGLNKLISKNLKAKEQGKKFTMNNGLYAFFSTALKIPEKIIEKFKELGSKINSINFSKSKDAAEKINNIVKEDTKGKIKEIVKADEFSKDTIGVLLHTLYLKSEWLLNKVKENKFSFSDINGDIYNVTSFEFKNQKVRLKQNHNVSFIALPMAGDSHIIIRHNNKDSHDLKYISEEEISKLMKSHKKEVNFEAPFVSMTETIDLKELLKEGMPKILDGTFQTKLGAPATVSTYIQMLTFDMNDKGAEASSATKMSMERGMPEPPVDIGINSPFTLAWIKEMGDTYYVLFQAQIVDTNVMKDAVLVKKNPKPSTQSEETSQGGSHHRRKKHSHSSSSGSDHTGSSSSSRDGKKHHHHRKPHAEKPVQNSNNVNNQTGSSQPNLSSATKLREPVVETKPAPQQQGDDEQEEDDECKCIVS